MTTYVSRNRRLLRAACATTVVVGVSLLLGVPSAGAYPQRSTARSGLGDPYFPDDGNAGYDVRHYDVRVAYDPAKPGWLTGDTTITARATTTLSVFHLDLVGFDVTAVSVDGRPAQKVGREGAHELVIRPAVEIKAGHEFTVRVRYAGATGKDWYTTDGGGAVALGEPHSATSWFPANDHPSDKATFDVTATVPTGWTVISNGRPGTTRTDAKSATFSWHEDRPIATYLTTIAIDRFTVHKAAMPDGTPLLYAYAPGTEIWPESEEVMPSILDFYADTFGPFPFGVSGATVVPYLSPPGAPLALETQGRPTYQGVFFEESMAHEVAHQWFGDSVSFADWRDGCIAECFATYAAQLWREHKGADIDEDYLELVAENLGDPEYWRVKLYDPGPGRELDSALYDKGALMLHALRRTVGDTAFFGTLRQWLRDHRYGNASFTQFEALAQRNTTVDLTGFFAEWAHGTTVPSPANLYPGPLADHK
jgi:aminopeptidase N